MAGSPVMPALVAAIHDFEAAKSWMAGLNPTMTLAMTVY